MKVGIIGDVHLGVNEENQVFVDYQVKCINFIFDEFKKQGITDIIYLGDILDKRQSISVKTIKLLKNILKNDFNQYFLIGNHDTVFKNSNELNSVELLLGEDNKVIPNLPEEIELGNKKFLITPWINKSNIEESTKIIKKSKANYMLAHLDLIDFEMIRGIVSRKSHIDLKLLNDFEHVISGHYHCYSNKNNITYLGSVCEITWIDHEVDKFCGWIDTETDKLTTLKIPLTIYEKIRIYTEDDCIDFEKYKNKIIKIYLYTDRNVKVEKFISSVIDVANSVKIIDEKAITDSSSDDLDIETKNMKVLDLWKNYVEEIEMEDNERQIITDIFQDAYMNIHFY